MHDADEAHDSLFDGVPHHYYEVYHSISDIAASM